LTVFDEKKYAIKILETGFQQPTKLFYDLLILSKYLFYIGKDKSQVKSDIFEFCENNISNFNKYLFAKELNRVISTASSSKLRADPRVMITESDLAVIEGLDSTNERQITFVLLVVFRLHNNHAFEISLDELFKLAKVKINSKTRYEILNSLHKKGVIEVSVDMKYKVKIEQMPEHPIITVENFEDMILYYRMMKGFEIKYCETCCRMIEPTNNKNKYCVICAKAAKTIQTKNSRVKNMRKIENAEND